MNARSNDQPAHEYTTMDRAHHALHEARNKLEFSELFAATTGKTFRQIVDEVVDPAAPKAVFAVGSIPLGMGASGSDVDLIVLVDSKAALLRTEQQIANNEQELEFASSSDLLLAGIYLSMNAGILVDLHVAITPTIHRIYNRLRRRGPELNETEIRTLGRLSSGWLLWEEQGYLEHNGAIVNDPALTIYGCTKEFVNALHQVAKARRALDSGDTALGLQHARLSVEAVYLAYFATENLPYLGSKWLAQLGRARGAAARLERQPMLAEGIPLLFPHYTENVSDVAAHLAKVTAFISAMRQVIEQKTLYRIALNACPQVHPL